jgi:flagellar M-ring protein FliF
MMQHLQVAVAAIVALILGLFVVRPILAGKPQVAALPAPEGVGDADATLGLIDATARQNQLAGPTEASPDAVARLREMIAERETETVQLLQEWMEDPAKKESA